MSSPEKKNVPLALWVALAVVALPLAIAFQSPLSPLGSGHYSFDESMYAYVAQGWRAGARPYADSWDHKGPLTYVLYALGFALSGGKAVGVWTVFWATIQGGFLVLYRLLRRFGTPGQAALGAFLGGVALIPLIREGATPEAFALFPTIAGLDLLAGLFHAEAAPRSRRLAAVGYGLCVAALLLLKANLAAPLMLAYLVVLGTAARRGGMKPALAETGLVALATAVPLAIWGFYAVSSGVAPWFVRAYFDYNVVYSKGTTLPGRVRTAWFIVKILTFSCAAPIPVLLALLPGRRPVEASGRGETALGTYGGFWVAAGLAAFAAWGVGAMAGHLFPHYAIGLVPFVALFGLVAVRRTAGWMRAANALDNGALVKGTLVTAWAPVGLLSVLTLLSSSELIGQARVVGAPLTELRRYVEANVGPGETLLVWNSSAWLNVTTGRRSPSRFFYSLPVLTRGYAPADLGQFVRELDRRPPKVIVDGERRNLFPPILAEDDYMPREAQEPSAAMTYLGDIGPLRAFVARRYRQLPDVDGFRVFLLKP